LFIARFSLIYIITNLLFRAKDSVTVFGVRPALYMCLEIQDDTITYYAIDTSKKTNSNIITYSECFS